MPSASVKKIIHCSKNHLISMVLDIEKYPEFIPWCVGSQINKKTDKGDTIEIVADLTIGKNFFKNTYKSLVIYNKEKDTIHVTNIDGPLKHLENKWFFKNVGKSSEINFYIDFELKNKILNILMSKYFNLGIKKITEAFEKRAMDLVDL